MKRTILLLALVTVTVTSLLYYLNYIKGKQELETKVQSVKISPAVIVTFAKSQQYSDSLLLIGKIQAWQRATVTSPLDGRLVDFKVEEGHEVKLGQILGKVYTPLRRLELARARITLKRSTRELQRLEQLDKTNNTTKSALDDARIAFEADQATLENLEQLEAESRIIAPIAGIIVTKHVQNGEYLQPGAEIVQITNIERLKIEAFISSDQLDKVKIGQLWKAQSVQHEKAEKVIVASINPEPSMARTYKVTWHGQNKPKNWLPGKSITLKLPISSNKKVWEMPSTAISLQNGKNFIQRLNQGVVQKLRVSVLKRTADDVTIDAQLSSGDSIIVTGHHLLAAGKKPGLIISE